MILWGFSVDSSSPEISLETATTVPATVTSSDVPTVVSELMTGNVSSVIDNFKIRRKQYKKEDDRS